VATFPAVLETEAVQACIATFARFPAFSKAFAPYIAVPAPAVTAPTIPLTTT